jgi:hypothetical protein
MIIMPSALLKKFAKRAGKSIDKVEEYWAAAKESAKAAGLKKGDSGYWAYANAIVQRRLGLSEAVSFREFLELTEDLGKPTTMKLEPGLSREEALKLCPWKKNYGDCRAFSYNPKTGEATWQ